MKGYQNISLLAGVFTALLLAGCATKEVYRNPAYYSMQPTTIHVLPVVDVRSDKSSVINPAPQLLGMIGMYLAQRGYVASFQTVFAPGRELSAYDVSKMGVEELAELGPSESKAILVVYLQDVESKRSALQTRYSLAISSALIDKVTKQYLWKSSGGISATSGGIVGFLEGGVVGMFNRSDEKNMSKAVWNLCGEMFGQKFPKAKKK